MTQEEKDALVEKMAIHLRENSPPWFPRKEKWEKLEERAREEWRKQARAALTIAEPIIRKKALEEAECKCVDLRAKFGTPAGSGYEEGCWDQGIRMEGAIRKLSEAE